MASSFHIGEQVPESQECAIYRHYKESKKVIFSPFLNTVLKMLEGHNLITYREVA